MVLLCVILFTHLIMIMYVARESCLIFVDEKTSSRMSQLLERKKLHIANPEYAEDSSKRETKNNKKQ